MPGPCFYDGEQLNHARTEGALLEGVREAGDGRGAGPSDLRGWTDDDLGPPSQTGNEDSQERYGRDQVQDAAANEFAHSPAERGSAGTDGLTSDGPACPRPPLPRIEEPERGWSSSPILATR